MGHWGAYWSALHHLLQRIVSLWAPLRRREVGFPLRSPGPRSSARSPSAPGANAHPLVPRYPSETSSASFSNYTGPSVESVGSTSSTHHFSNSKLGAAIAVPILALAACVAAYVLYNKRRKQPAAKRYSAAVDHRISMISNGTMPAPRHSMAASRASMAQSRASVATGRPSFAGTAGGRHREMSERGSVFGGVHERAASGYSQLAGEGARGSRFGEPGARPGSTFSTAASLAGSAVARPSPLGEGGGRQIGQGERASHVSFAGGEGPAGRPSFSSSRKGPASIYSRHRESLHGAPPSPNLPPPPPLPSASPRKGDRHSQSYFAFGPHARHSTAGSVHSLGAPSGGSPPIAAGMGRSHTTEELASAVLQPPRTRGREHARTKSSLQQVYRASIAEEIGPALAYLDQPEGSTTPSTVDGDRPKSPFDDPVLISVPPVAVTAPERALSPVSDMIVAYGAGTNPDEAFAEYSKNQSASTSPALSAAPTMAGTPSSASMIKSRSAGLLAGFSAGSGKLIRSLSTRSAGLRAGAVSPTIPVDPSPAPRPTSPPAPPPAFSTVISPPPEQLGMVSSASTPIAAALARGAMMARSASGPVASELDRARLPLSPARSHARNPFRDVSSDDGGESPEAPAGEGFVEAM